MAAGLRCAQGRIGREHRSPQQGSSAAFPKDPPPRQPAAAANDSAQLWALLRSPEQRQKQLRGSAKCPGTILHDSYASLTRASCLGIRNSPTGYRSKEGKRWRPEPKTQTEQINAGEFQEFSYVSPQQRRGNTSKGTTALSFPTQAVAIISIIHLRRELAFQ